MFIVNAEGNKVILTFYDDVIVANESATVEEQQLIFDIKIILDQQFSNLSIVRDVFVVDTDSRAIYIGKAALEYQRDIKVANTEERILH